MGCQVRRHWRRAFRYRSFNPAPRLRPNAPKTAPFLAAPDTKGHNPWRTPRDRRPFTLPDALFAMAK